MKTKLFLFLCTLLVSVIQPLSAETTDIPLFVVDTEGNDGPSQDGKDPITPNQFTVTLSNRILSISTFVAEEVSLLIQNEETKEIVINTKFENNISYDIIDHGSYILYIAYGDTKLFGKFSLVMSQDEAAGIVLKMFETEEDVDVFVSNNIYKGGDTIHVVYEYLSNEYIVAESDSWVAFVDLDIQANWGHSCQYVLVDAVTGKTTVYQREMFPVNREIFKPYRVADRNRMPISQQEACSLVEKEYSSDSVSIYISNRVYVRGERPLCLLNGDTIITPKGDFWVALVDLYPYANWSHPCKYLYINRWTKKILEYENNMPPIDFYPLFSIYKGANVGSVRNNSKPYHQGLERMNRQGGRTETNKWAIIISGGCNIYSNYFRYWRDCSAVYKTLIANGYDPEHIYVAMADGTSPSVDYMDDTYALCSSPLDLDGDEVPDIQYPATRDGIFDLFYDMDESMPIGDELFIFTTDHGYANDGHSYLSLWDNTNIADFEFAGLVANLEASIINIVMEQCMSGGFIDDFQDSQFSQVVITTACSPTEQSFSTFDMCYDEFIYWWCTAVNGVSPDNVVYGNADYNFDGYVSMREAYRFVCEHDRRNETPLQYSKDECLKYSLTLANLLNLCDDAMIYNGSDIFIKDNSADFGAEPNITTDKQWISTDIWLEDLNGEVVGTLQSGSTYKVCARVYNRGNQASPGGELIYWHWTKAVIGGSWPYSWFEDYDYYCGNTPIIRGAVINPLGTVIPSINAGENVIVYDYWTVPELDYSICSAFNDDLEQLWHYCLLARIVDQQDQPGEDMEEQSLTSLVLNHNNVASCNFSIISDLNTSYDGFPAAVVGVAVPNMQNGYYHIYCDLLDTTMEWGGYTHLYLTMSPNMYNNWSLHGSGFNDMNGWGRLEIIANHAELLDIYMSGTDLYPLKVEIEQTLDEPRDMLFDIYLVNQNDSIIGGERFVYRGSGTNFGNTNPSVPYEEQHSENSQVNFNIWCSPNPVETVLSVSSSENILSVYIYDTNGQNVVSSKNTTIDVSRLVKGIYMIIAEGANGYSQTKFVKL